MKKFIIALLLIPIISSAAQQPCGNAYEKRAINGRTPTAATLYRNIQGIESGAWKSGFWEETFTYIGDAHTRNGITYKVGYLTTIWGKSCRVTNRLFVFSKENVCLGSYSGITEIPIKIAGSVLYFPFDTDDGNAIDLENGPPVKARIDGKNQQWMPAKKL